MADTWVLELELVAEPWRSSKSLQHPAISSQRISIASSRKPNIKRALVARSGFCDSEHELSPTSAEDPVSLVSRAIAGLRAVRRLREHFVAHSVVEVEL